MARASRRDALRSKIDDVEQALSEARSPDVRALLVDLLETHRRALAALPPDREDGRAVQLVPAARFAPAELAELFTAGYEDYAFPLQVDEPTLRFMARTWDWALDASAVALQGEERVGICMLGVRGVEGWIGGLGVTKPARRNGVGEALMRHVLERAAAQGIERISLEVLVENEQAIRLYEKLGFEHVRELEVWSLPGAPGPTIETSAAHAHELCRALRGAPEPWQRADETVAHLLSEDPPPVGLTLDGGAAIVRVKAGRASVLQLAARSGETTRRLLESARALGDSLHWLNVPAGDLASAALGELGGTVEARQHELALAL